MCPFLLLLLAGGWASLFLRVVFGAIMMVHGLPKLKDIKATVANFAGMGFRPGAFWGPLAAVLEFFGGIALILGVMVSPIAALFAGEFLVIVIWKLIKRGAFVGGWEFDLLLLAVSFALFLLGAGAWSLDYLRAGRF